jgi:predicted O-methyltransferase YrrM
LLKKLANDCIKFSGDPRTAFFQALDQGAIFLKESPQSSFSIIFDSRSNQVELHLERVAARQDYEDLFGSGDVPGYLTEGDMAAIEQLVKKIPDTGTIVEVGSFLGKSAIEWAKNTAKQNKDYKIICIDSFTSTIEILQDLLDTADFVVPDSDSHFQMFRHYTKPYSNIVWLEAFFNEDFEFDQQVDLLFEDSDHTQRTLNHALPFWWSRINPGGILSGHDYCLREVKTAVDIFAVINNLEVKLFSDSSIWYIEKE